MSDSRLLDYARELIALPSPSRQPNLHVAGKMKEWLSELGFQIEEIGYTDPHGIPKLNLVARRGEGSGGMAYFGHNDCVPVENWTGPGGPFAPVVENGRLYGRGSCDMKGSLAAMLEAARRTQHEPSRHPLYYVCTADEEVGYLGAQEVAARSELYRELVQGDAWTVIGEATGLQVVHAHKGGIGFRAVAHGVAAHSSTRNGKNANLIMIPFLTELKAIYDEAEQDEKWHDAEFDPPTLCINIGINDGNTAVNITAPQSVCTIYMRPMPGIDVTPLVDRITEAASRHGLELQKMFDGPAVRTDPRSPIVQDVLQLVGQAESHTVCYGTDACAFQDIESLVIFGPGDIAQAHTDDEWISLEQLQQGADYYTQLVRRWCHE